MSNGKQFTWVADDKLTGWERAYTEVERKAAKGELIKVVSSGTSTYDVGNVLKITEVDELLPYQTRRAGEARCGWLYDHEYVVLDPTSIVREIGGITEYRLVSRMGHRGESIVFEDGTSNLTCGKPYLIVSDRHYGGEFKDEDGYSRWQYVGNKPKSYVLERTVVARTECTDHLDALAAAGRNIAELQRRVSDLEAEVVKQAESLQDAAISKQSNIKQLVAELSQSINIAKGKSRELTRGDVVKRAQADVADLRKFVRAKPPVILYGFRKVFYPYTDGKEGYVPIDRVKYVVNRDKRTVVALITGTSDTRAWAKGIAKAAPGDVFNEHIGKAIALHRALGLPVPSEYLNAPEPEGFRVDDVVTNRDGVYADVRFTSTLLHRLPGYDGVTIKGVYCGDAWRHSYSHGWVGENQIRVVDDSARYSAVGNEVSA